MENTPTPKPKKDNDSVKVDKSFILKIAKQLGDLSSRVQNLEALNETEAEVKKLQPTQSNMTRILGKPEINIEVDFPQHFTMDQIKEQGFRFQSELEQLFAKYNVREMHINYKREIR